MLPPRNFQTQYFDKISTKIMKQKRDAKKIQVFHIPNWAIPTSEESEEEYFF